MNILSILNFVWDDRIEGNICHIAQGSCSIASLSLAQKGWI